MLIGILAVIEERTQYIIKKDDIAVDLLCIYDLLRNIDQNEHKYLLKGFLLTNQSTQRKT